jgi:GTP diphosphokinase / guanosine-3',5'-bis(diphosphate) 3'-diphosphatase
MTTDASDLDVQAAAGPAEAGSTPPPEPEASTAASTSGTGSAPAAEAPARRQAREPGRESRPDRPAAEPTLPQRVRGLVARSVMSARRAQTSALMPLISVHESKYPQADMRVLQQAYKVAEHHHRGQVRRSGEPFITHPLAVATILAELGMDTTTLVAALLHDTVEDTEYTLAASQSDFGLEVAHLIDGVTKLDKVRFGDSAEAETIRKMIVAAGRDLRVLVIKLADRLHNMRTLRYQPRHKQERIARATLDFLVPLADRLGIHVLKGELEGLCFSYLQPEDYAKTIRMVSRRAPARHRLLGSVVSRAEADLRANRVNATVSDRPRQSFSAYKTTKERGGDAELLDPARILVVISGEPADCYAALGVIHGRWRPVPGRFKDYIAVPKFNMYQSLHTTVLGPGSEPVDVLIRTESMHRVAEYGVAAHIREATLTGSGLTDRTGGPGDLDWLRRLLAWQREVDDAGEFFRTLRSDLGRDREILVFTDEGEALALPDGATPIDFAYALRSDVGHRCIGVRVNNRLVSLACPLSDGDVVEVLTSPSESPGPSGEWLRIVRTPTAHVKIRQWFAEQSRDAIIERGRQALDAAFRGEPKSLDDAIENGSLQVVALELGHRQLEELYAAVAEGEAGPEDVLVRTRTAAPDPEPRAAAGRAQRGGASR